MTGRIFIFFLVALALPWRVQAGAVPSAVFNTTTGRSGLCLAPLKGSPESALSRYGMKIRNGRQGKGRSVIPTSGTDPKLALNMARVVQRVESLGGSKIANSMKGLTVWSAPDLNIPARHNAQGLVMKSEHVGNIAMIAHELGHQVGNHGWYQKYNRTIKSKCVLSTYCNANHNFGARNEEFAEVFSAFLTHPNLLRNGSKACQDAYKFLSQEMFGGREPNCDGNPNAPIDDFENRNRDDEKCDDATQVATVRNHQDLRAVSESLEVASHTQETAEYESSLNGQALVGMAVQFAPVALSFFQARAQSKELENANLPNLVINPGVSAAATNPFAPQPSRRPVGSGHAFGGVDPVETAVPQPVDVDSMIFKNAAEEVAPADSPAPLMIPALPSENSISPAAPPPGAR